MSAEQRALTDLAASVADGRPVDWDAAQATVAGEQQRLVRHLRLVSSVAELYRSLPVESPEALAPHADPQGPRWGHLVMLETLGKGTTAEVYRAWDLPLQREVALKLFPPDEGGNQGHARVLSEARRLARVRHPNVATVYGAERHGDRVGFWMELVRGASLDETLNRQGPFGAREAALIGSEIASALAAVHGAGLLHRDVKAQNVLREDGGRIVLTDFGTGEEANAPGPARMAGTPMYLAPEILRGRAATVQSDVYSLGVLLFLLTTAKFPIDATSMLELARAHAEGSRLHLRDLRPDLPSGFVDAVEKALAASPSDRFASAGAFEEALRRTLEAPRAPDAPAEPAHHGRERRKSRTGPLTLLALALVVLALAVGSWWDRSAPAGAGARSAAIDSLAVLPLEDMSGENASLADAFTDQLITTLGQVRAVRVTSRSSVMPFRGSLQPAQAIARSLGVGALLKGSLWIGGSDGRTARPIRVTARVIAAGSGEQLWSGTFQGTLGDAAVVESRIAQSIARGIRIVLAPREADRLASAARTTPQAEEAYFQGRYHLNRYGVESASRALRAFERATELDNNYAPAFAGVARAYVTLGFSGAFAQPDARARALAAANRALSIDPELSEAQAAVADLRFYYDWDWEGAQTAYLRAIDLNPSVAYVRTQYARFLAAAGRTNEAVAEAVAAERLDPLSATASETTGLMLYYAREYDRAATELQHALEVDPTFDRARAVLARVREAQGRVDEALAEIDRAIAGAQQADPTWYAYRARLVALQGDRAAAETALSQLRRGPLRVPPENLAYVRLAFGDEDKAISLLEEAADQRDPGLLWLRVDPRVDQLRGSPRFAALMRRIGPGPN